MIFSDRKKNKFSILGSKVIRLVRAKQAPKRKTSLDNLIEVVQKELLRVNNQNNSISPSPSPPSQIRSLPSTKLQNRIFQSTPHRSIISTILPSSHHSFKLTRKRGIINLNNSKKISLLQQRSKSYNNDDDNNYIDNDDIEQSTDDGPENIEEIVRDTVDRLVAITLLNNAPFIVNMLTPVPGNGNSTNTESKILTTKSQLSTVNDLRNSIQQTSPIKQQIHHPQLIIQPTTTPSPISTTPTLFVAPRILNFQTVVPKPTTNIQIGNTKIILVSPSNITQHLPHTTTSIQPPNSQQQQNLINNSPVKLVKFTPTNNNNNNNNSIITRTTNPTQTLTLPKNVQIVIPSQTPSTIQLTRTHNDDLNKSIPTTTTTTFRPVTSLPMTLTTCTVDQIPQAAQEVTITTSPTSSPPLITNTNDLQQQSTLGTTVNVISSNSNNQSPNQGNSQQQYFLTNSSENNNNNNNNNNGSTIEKTRRRSSSSAPPDKPVGKILRPIAKVLPVYSPNNSNNNHG